MIILIILGIVTLLLGILVVVTILLDKEIGMGVSIFLCVISSIIFIAFLTSYFWSNVEREYINKTYDKAYTQEEYFYNGYIIKQSILPIKNNKSDIDLHIDNEE